MCTATWRIAGDEGYELFFNRDELKTRLPGLPPSLHILNGVPYLAPSDGDEGGTWVGVNESGVSLCILNLYGSRIQAPRANARSRGLLVGSMLDVRRLSELATRIGRATLEEFNPFLLVGLAPRAAPLAFRWDGKSVALQELTAEDLPVTTSSVAPERVAKHRRKVFRDLAGEAAPTPEMLSAFHRGAPEKDRSFSVCMNRPDASTVSHSHIQVDPHKVVFQYYRVLAAEGRFAGPMTMELPRQLDVIPSHIRSSSHL